MPSCNGPNLFAKIRVDNQGNASDPRHLCVIAGAPVTWIVVNDDKDHLRSVTLDNFQPSNPFTTQPPFTAANVAKGHPKTISATLLDTVNIGDTFTYTVTPSKRANVDMEVVDPDS